jgi:hypothetical protein
VRISDFIDLDQPASSRFPSRSKTSIVGSCSSLAMARVCSVSSECIPERWPSARECPPSGRRAVTVLRSACGGITSDH